MALQALQRYRRICASYCPHWFYCEVAVIAKFEARKGKIQYTMLSGQNVYSVLFRLFVS
jgi:hypothetical protein